jgi:feruloyl esterase
MKRLLSLALIIAAPVFLPNLALAATPAPDCAAAAAIALPNVTITSTEAVAAGALKLDDASLNTAALPAFCRVVGKLTPRAKSEIHFEIWLPDAWNGRYLQAGNGGFAGSIAYYGLVAGLKNGFAVTNQDGGHRSNGADMGWAVGPTEAIDDFGNRALYETAKMSKSLVAAYYGKPAHHAYFSGCSDGGRESLMSAQRYPDEFDGWVVGAPENDFTRELTSELVLTQTGRMAAKKMTSKHLSLVAEDARKRCDAADGLEDGIISDPRTCSANVDALTCTGGDNGECLPKDIAASIKATYAGAPASASHAAFSGLDMSIGTEDDAGGWGTWMSDVDAKGAGWHEPYAQEYFGSYIYQDKNLDLSKLDPEKAYADAFKKAGQYVDALDTDLSKQRAAGKKILQYHGWSDVGIPVHASIDYYTGVEKKLGGPIDDFYRLFLVPGMGHCGGGPGANYFGGNSDAATPFTPDRNALAAVVDWVEKGKAPDSLVATKYKGNDPKAEVVMTRPICVYPKTTHYKGSGPASEASSFECR